MKGEKVGESKSEGSGESGRGEIAEGRTGR